MANTALIRCSIDPSRTETWVSPRHSLLSLGKADKFSTATGLVKSADLLTPSEPDAGSSAPDGNIYHGRQWGAPCSRSDLVGAAETASTSPARLYSPEYQWMFYYKKCDIVFFGKVCSRSTLGHLYIFFNRHCKSHQSLAAWCIWLGASAANFFGTDYKWIPIDTKMPESLNSNQISNLGALSETCLTSSKDLGWHAGARRILKINGPREHCRPVYCTYLVVYYLMHVSTLVIK